MKHDEIKNLASDLAMEIIYGCGRLDNRDLFDAVNEIGVDTYDLRKAVIHEIESNEKLYPKETYDSDFLDSQFENWFHYFK